MNSIDFWSIDLIKCCFVEALSAFKLGFKKTQGSNNFAIANTLG